MPTFENDEEARNWADQWTSERLPTPLVLQTIDEERAHFARFNADYGRYVGQFEVEYQSLAELIDHLNFVDRSSWPEHRSVQYALSAYNLRTFYSALDRLVRGYYEDCIALTRGLYETFVRMLFVSCYPDSAYNVLVRKPPKGRAHVQPDQLPPRRPRSRLGDEVRDLLCLRPLELVPRSRCAQARGRQGWRAGAIRRAIRLRARSDRGRGTTAAVRPRLPPPLRRRATCRC